MGMRRARRHVDAVQLRRRSGLRKPEGSRVVRLEQRSHGAPRRAEASQSMAFVRHGRERRGMVSGLVRLPAWRSSDRSDRPCFQCERTESRARRRLRQLRTVLPIGRAASLFRVPASHRYRPRLPRGARHRTAIRVTFAAIPEIRVTPLRPLCSLRSLAATIFACFAWYAVSFIRVHPCSSVVKVPVLSGGRSQAPPANPKRDGNPIDGSPQLEKLITCITKKTWPGLGK